MSTKQTKTYQEFKRSIERDPLIVFNELVWLRKITKTQRTHGQQTMSLLLALDRKTEQFSGDSAALIATARLKLTGPLLEKQNES